MEGKRSWVEIDLHQLRRNYEIYESFQPAECGIMAVGKADAYGHGDKEVTASLDAMGVKHFVVSIIDEALHVRNDTNP